MSELNNVFMKILMYIFVLFLTTSSCHNKINKNEKGINIKFKSVVSHHIIDPVVLAIKRDSVFSIVNFTDEKDRFYIYESTAKNGKDGAYSFRPEEISKKEGRDKLFQMNQMNFCFKSVLKPLIKYDEFPTYFNSKLLPKKVIDKDTKFHKYQGKYYFTNIGSSHNFYIYDPQNEYLVTLKNLPEEWGGYLNLRDFFLFDFMGDAKPEVIILSDGQISREGVVLLDILSITEN